MSPATLIERVKADGVKLDLSPCGSIKAVGSEQAVTRWLPVIRERKAELLDVLRKSPDEREIVAWLESIGEHDPVIIRATLDKCRASNHARAFFLELARHDETGPVH